jgi:hypothetical protein
MSEYPGRAFGYITLFLIIMGLWALMAWGVNSLVDLNRDPLAPQQTSVQVCIDVSDTVTECHEELRPIE